MRRVCALATALALSACAMLSPRDPSDLPFAPLSPASLGRAVQADQILRIAYGESGLTLQCAARVTAAETSLDCFTALGQRAIHLKHDGQTVSAESAAPSASAGDDTSFSMTPAAAQDAHSISPERILTDLQLAYWPLPALTAALAADEWQLSEPAPGVRRLRRNGALHTEIHYAKATPWNGRLWLVNFEQRYSLDIDSRTSAKK